MGGGNIFPKMSHQKSTSVKIEKLHLWVLTSCSGIKQRNWNKLLLGTSSIRAISPNRVASALPQNSGPLTGQVRPVFRGRGLLECLLEFRTVLEHAPVVFSRSGLEAGWSELQVILNYIASG